MPGGGRCQRPAPCASLARSECSGDDRKRVVEFHLEADSDEDPQMRALLTPAQARQVAAWLRIAAASGATLAQARVCARRARGEMKRAARGGPLPYPALSLTTAAR